MGSRIPDSRADMRRAGYKLLGRGTCKALSCKAGIEWWQTTNGKKIPLDPGGEDDATVPHWATCRDANEFRSDHASVEASAKAAAPAGRPATRVAVERELQSLMQRVGAGCALLVFEDGDSFAFRHGLDPEDMRTSLIASANHVRDAIRREQSQAEGGR